MAIEAVRRIDEIFAIERTILGKTLAERVAVRQDLSKPLVIALETFLRDKRALLSTKSEAAKAINYSLNHWPAFTRFLDDGRICLSNNAAERALRGIAIGRRNWTFCGSTPVATGRQPSNLTPSQAPDAAGFAAWRKEPA